MKLLYVRHGKTRSNLDKVYAGRSESPLLEEGIEDSKNVGRQILSADENINVIYSSSLERQLDTARLIAEEINYPIENIRIDDLLLERSGGNFEGGSQSNFFTATEEEQVAAGAESLSQLAERAESFLAKIEKEHSNDTVLVVGSATMGEMLRAVIKHNDYTKVFDESPLPNSELVQLI